MTRTYLHSMPNPEPTYVYDPNAVTLLTGQVGGHRVIEYSRTVEHVYLGSIPVSETEYVNER